jgi:hypothetical protein
MKLLQVFFQRQGWILRNRASLFLFRVWNISGGALITSEDLYDKLVSQSKHGREKKPRKRFTVIFQE